VDEVLLEISRTLGASMVAIAVAALGVGMVGLLGARMTQDPRAGQACGFAQQLSAWAGAIGVGGGAVALVSHWRAGHASTVEFALAEVAMLATGAAFALFVVRMLGRERRRSR
jgi:hypothetical protein